MPYKKVIISELQESKLPGHQAAVAKHREYPDATVTVFFPEEQKKTVVEEHNERVEIEEPIEVQDIE